MDRNKLKKIAATGLLSGSLLLSGLIPGLTGQAQAANTSTYRTTNQTSYRITYRLVLYRVPGTNYYSYRLVPINTQPSTPVPQPQPQPQPSPAPAPTPAPAPAGQLTAEEQQMVNLVNAERVKAGLQPLQVDMTLVRLARMKSQDMIDKNYFAHQSPTYGSPFDMMRNYGVSFRYAGENLAGNQTVERAHAALMNSPGHRANILNPNFTHIGIGIVAGGPYGKMFTQMFVGR